MRFLLGLLALALGLAAATAVGLIAGYVIGALVLAAPLVFTLSAARARRTAKRPR